MKRNLSLLALVQPVACGGGGSKEADLEPDAGMLEQPDGGAEPVADAGMATSTSCTLRTRVYGLTAVLHHTNGSVFESGTTDDSGAISFDDCPPLTADCLGNNPDVLSVLAVGRIGDVWVYSHSDGDIDITENGVTTVELEDMTTRCPAPWPTPVRPKASSSTTFTSST